MAGLIHRSEISNGRWIETSMVRLDGREEFRQRPKYGNLHAIFEIGSEWGEIHTDEHNALDFPNGTVDHLAKYTEEKTSIPQNLARVGIVIGGIIAGAALLKYLGEKIK